MLKILLSILILALVATGCAVMPAGLAPSANHQPSTQSYEVLGRSSGSASHFTLFSIIPFGKANIDKAVQEAIDKKGGDNLINVRYWQKTTWVFIGTLTSFEIEGVVVKYTKTAEQAEQTTVYTPTPTQPEFKPTVQGVKFPNVNNVSLGRSGRYKRGESEGFSGLNIAYRGRDPDSLYYFFPAVTIATMSKEIELYWESYKIGSRVFSISGCVGFNPRHTEIFSDLLPSKLNPYLELGIGYVLNQYWQDYWDESDWDWFALTWNSGLGVEYWLTKQMALDLYLGRRHIIDIDPGDSYDDEDFHYWDVNLGLTFR